MGGRRGEVGGREVGRRRGKQILGQRRGKQILGQRRGKQKQYLWAGRMCFWFIPKTASTASSAIGALVAAGSLQPI